MTAVPDYVLAPDAIAQHPVEPRDAARMLVSLDATSPPQHSHVRDLPDLVGPGDVVVVNTSRVLPARLRLRKRSGGEVEVFLLEAEPDAADGTWVALVRPGRRVAPGTVLVGPDGRDDIVEVGDRLDDGRRLVRLLIADAPATFGEIPLPPYIHEPLTDPERYQTVYADRPASVAAPTAGLHLTTEVLDRCRRRGAQVAGVDLAVGLGTFRPVQADQVEGHVMHVERYQVDAPTMEACRSARRVVAVGTTTVRALESAAATGSLEGRSSLFISGDYPFEVVDVLFTNFHQPRSTLLILLEAFCGPRWRDLYGRAQRSGYRFLSFGDAMIVARAGRGR